MLGSSPGKLNLWKGGAVYPILSLTYLLLNWASCLVRFQLPKKALRINEYLHVFDLTVFQQCKIF